MERRPAMAANLADVERQPTAAAGNVLKRSQLDPFCFDLVPARGAAACPGGRLTVQLVQVHMEWWSTTMSSPADGVAPVPWMLGDDTEATLAEVRAFWGAHGWRSTAMNFGDISTAKLMVYSPNSGYFSQLEAKPMQFYFQSTQMVEFVGLRDWMVLGYFWLKGTLKSHVFSVGYRY